MKKVFLHQPVTVATLAADLTTETPLETKQTVEITFDPGEPLAEPVEWVSIQHHTEGLSLSLVNARKLHGLLYQAINDYDRERYTEE